MLSKLRSVEKYDVVEDSLTKILDIYERRYLSLPSTRKAGSQSSSKKRR